MRCFFFFSLIFLVGCAPYRIPKEHLGSRHWLYDIVPRHRCQIRWYDLGHWTMWALFGNDDDGLFGGSNEHVGQALKFWVRNPLHNFCFYVIGSADRENSRVTFLRIGDGKVSMMRYHKRACGVFGGKGNSFLFALHGFKPFFSLRLVYLPMLEGQFYFGWRERGNFGIKFQPIRRRCPES